VCVFQEKNTGCYFSLFLAEISIFVFVRCFASPNSENGGGLWGFLYLFFCITDLYFCFRFIPVAVRGIRGKTSFVFQKNNTGCYFSLFLAEISIFVFVRASHRPTPKMGVVYVVLCLFFCLSLLYFCFFLFITVILLFLVYFGLFWFISVHRFLFVSFYRVLFNISKMCI